MLAAILGLFSAAAAVAESAPNQNLTTITWLTWLHAPSPQLPGAVSDFSGLRNLQLDAGCLVTLIHLDYITVESVGHRLQLQMNNLVACFPTVE